MDMQESMRDWVPRFDDLMNNIAKLVLTFQMFEMPVLVTEQDPATLGNTVEPVRKLFKFLEVTEKMEFAATDNPHFQAQLNPLGVKTFVVCGVETHVSVCQTVLGLLDQGLAVHVVADAVHARHALSHSLALRKMELAGAHIATTEMCLFELAQKADADGFKNIQRMVKGKFLPGGRGRSLAPATPSVAREIRPGAPLPRISSVKEPPEQAGPNAVQPTEKPVDLSDAVAQEVDNASNKPIDAVAAVDEILGSLGGLDDDDKSLAHTEDKTENEINKDLNDIDSILKNLENNDNNV
jgi:nicotinamidase-related amidase